jgi:hypothetical protein
MMTGVRFGPGSSGYLSNVDLKSMARRRLLIATVGLDGWLMTPKVPYYYTILYYTIITPAQEHMSLRKETTTSLLILSIMLADLHVDSDDLITEGTDLPFNQLNLINVFQHPLITIRRDARFESLALIVKAGDACLFRGTGFF